MTSLVEVVDGNSPGIEPCVKTPWVKYAYISIQQLVSGICNPVRLAMILSTTTASFQGDVAGSTYCWFSCQS